MLLAILLVSHLGLAIPRREESFCYDAVSLRRRRWLN
jgi:hypothetical protein